MTTNTENPNEEPWEEPRKKGGDCLTPTATLLALLVTIVYAVARWVWL